MTGPDDAPRRRRVALDVDDPDWHRLLVDHIRWGTEVDGTFGPVSRKRASAVADKVLALLADRAEDLEPLFASMEEKAREARLEASRSAARQAVVEGRLGIGPKMVSGEVLAARDDDTSH